MSFRFGLWHLLPLWKRIEGRGITLIPTFSHQGRRGSYQAIPGCEFFYSSLDNKSGFLNTLKSPPSISRLGDFLAPLAGAKLENTVQPGTGLAGAACGRSPRSLAGNLDSP